jgi:hypothetical protein
MWHIGRDKWYLFDVGVILKVVSLYRDESELDVDLFNDDGNNLTLFELIIF